MFKTRLANEAKYFRTLRGKQSTPATAAQYNSRSATTGNRKLTTADGGINYGQFLSNSEPGRSPMLIQGSLGLTGFVNQKPI